MCKISLFYSLRLSINVSEVCKVARQDPRYQVWNVNSLKDGQKIFLRNLDNKGAITICKERSSAMDIKVEGMKAMHVQKMLRDRDIKHDVLATEVSPVTVISRIRSPGPNGSGVFQPCIRPRFKSPAKNVIDWKNYYTLEMLYAFMDSLEKKYPSTCTATSIGRSVEGREIMMLKISNSDASNTAVWLDGAIHAREWISTSVVTYIADYIAQNFDSLPISVTNKDWYFVPVLNPDGYVYSHQADRMWRKSRARFGKTIVGVDLNRNFGHLWGKNVSDSSSSDPNHINYRGVEAFSEPETAAVKDIILYSGTPFKIFLTFHAFSEVIAFPWCYTNDPCPDYVTLLEGATIMAKAIYKTNGKMYKVGNFKDIMYYASGTSIDWSYGTAKIPYSYLVELRGKEHKFLLPKEDILDCCKEVLNGVLALAEFVDKEKCTNCIVLSNRNRR